MGERREPPLLPGEFRGALKDHHGRVIAWPITGRWDFDPGGADRGPARIEGSFRAVLAESFFVDGHLPIYRLSVIVSIDGFAEVPARITKLRGDDFDHKYEMEFESEGKPYPAR